jgi:osmotically inducible protein OsmC
VAKKRSASAVWKGGLKDGKGTISTESGIVSGVPYNFRKRFENEKGTNPEELIAAAHAACFSMALSMILGEAGMTAENIATKATVSLDQVVGGFAVTSSHLETTVKIPNADRGLFRRPSRRPSGCRFLLLNATITMDTKSPDHRRMHENRLEQADSASAGRSGREGGWCRLDRRSGAERHFDARRNHPVSPGVHRRSAS